MGSAGNVWARDEHDGEAVEKPWPVMVDDEGEIEDEDFFDDDEEDDDELSDDEDDHLTTTTRMTSSMTTKKRKICSARTNDVPVVRRPDR